jgi:hypothetical protein
LLDVSAAKLKVLGTVLIFGEVPEGNLVIGGLANVDESEEGTAQAERLVTV